MTRGKLGEFLESFGPAWIVMIAEVDAPSILTGATVGAIYGYGLTWFFLLLIVPLFVIQEASGRIGIATGRGLGDVIRSSYSKRLAVLASLPMATVDVVSYVAEYAGIAIGMSLVGVPPFISMPVAYAAHILIIRRREYVTIEKVLFVISTVLIISYAGSLFARGLSSSSFLYFSGQPRYLFLLAASAGAVVMPFMLFYQASATAKKGEVKLWAMRTETLVGAIASELGMIVIVIATSGLSSSVNYAQPKTLALALSSIAGAYAPYLFAVGLVAAAFLALVVISLASSWAVVEAMGWQRSSFFWVYVIESLPAVAVPILYPEPLTLVLNLMVVFVFVLAGPGILMGRLASDKRIMGDYVSSKRWKSAYWLSLAMVLSLGVVALVVIL
ncbi:MAG: divalent metal cation transporter [Nitrososphaerota archaeon]|nr:divalent metal cation transporter [Nitrososphaerota archaeon]